MQVLIAFGVPSHEMERAMSVWVPVQGIGGKIGEMGQSAKEATGLAEKPKPGA